MSKAISDYMTEMPHSINKTMTVKKGLEMMTQYSCHHLPVLEDGNIVGIVSDRDLRIIGKATDVASTPIEKVMTDDPLIVDRNDDVRQIVITMKNRGIGSVIVRGDADKPWGIFTATDAISYLSKEN